MVIDRDTGDIEATLPLPGVPDVVMHDARSQRLYVAVGEPGTATVIDTAALALIETVPTEPGAHTLAYDSAGKTLYVFCPASCRIALYAEVDGSD